MTKMFPLMKSIRTLLLALAISAVSSNLWAVDGEGFASPQDAVNTLVSAARDNDTNALHQIFGPESHQLVSPDAVQAADAYKLFVKRVTEKTQLVNISDTRAS